GRDLEPLAKQITQEMCDAFSGPQRNYHNDRELARALGFPDIVVQGMMSICFASELMTRSFGLGWLCGGKLDVSLVSVVWGVWCEKPDGVKTLVGTASALR